MCIILLPYIFENIKYTFRNLGAKGGLKLRENENTDALKGESGASAGSMSRGVSCSWLLSWSDICKGG